MSRHVSWHRTSEGPYGWDANSVQAFERKYTNDEDSAANGMEEQKKDDDEKFGKTIVVQDMHTRKKTMVDEVRAGGPGSGFVALSGGYGTMEELMEVSLDLTRCDPEIC